MDAEPTQDSLVDVVDHQVVYRAYGRDGVLLYVGVTLDPAGRFMTHQREKGWWRDVEMLRLEHHLSRAGALTAEKSAIQDEDPRHNVVHSKVLSLVQSPNRTSERKRIARPLRLTDEEAAAVEAVAVRETEGNFSMAARKLIEEALAVRNERQAQGSTEG